MLKADTINIYSDGGCRPNPGGPGGYGLVLETLYQGKPYRKEIKKGFIASTNNRMELRGAIRGIEEVKKKVKINLHTDSGYVVNAFNKGWIYNWKKKNFMKKGKDIPNADLWKIIYELVEENDVTFIWVKGHNGHPENERCDELATEALLEEAINVDEGFKKENYDL